MRHTAGKSGKEAGMVFVFLLMALFGAAALVFAVQNPDPVALTFLGWRTTSMPVAFLLLVSAFVGVLAASVSGFAEKIRLQLRIRELERQLSRLTAVRPMGPVREVAREPVREPLRERLAEPVSDRMAEPVARTEARPPRW
jgi:uncharacterized integral membrane protein